MDQSNSDHRRRILIPSTTLPVLDEAEVVIIGGGSAGLIAAIAAARSGAQTILIERGAYVGGAFTSTYVTEPQAFGDSDDYQIIKGIGWELMERLEARGAAIIDRNSLKVQIFPEMVKTIGLEMLEEAKVKLYLYTPFCETITNNGVITGIIVLTKTGRAVIEGKVFIDASGDADVAFQAGSPYEKSSVGQLWQVSCDLTVANVKGAKVVEWANDHPELAMPAGNFDFTHEEHGIQPMFNIIIPNETTRIDKNGIHHVGPMPTIKLLIHRNICRVQGSVEIDGTDNQGLTYAEREGRKLAFKHLEYLKQIARGFEDAVVVSESILGVRETRRIIGEYVMSYHDITHNARFPDSVALSCRAIDRHMKGEVFKIEMLKGFSQIPLRSLMPNGIQNLLVAGRCLSCDHDAHASLRGAATCLAMGHAAGTAAALAVKSNISIREIKIEKLQAILKSQNAILA